MNDTTYYKEILEKRRAELEKELSGLGIHSQSNPTEWEVKVPELDIMTADENEVADKSEEVQIDSIIVSELTTQYKNVIRALKKIEEGKYGICEVCGEPIEKERLQVAPSARTCEKHLDEENKAE